MFVAVHIREDIANDLARDGDYSLETSRLLGVFKERGLDLQPMHSGSVDPQLKTHYFVSVPDEQSARELTKVLLTFPVVMAAYVKPPDSVP